MDSTSSSAAKKFRFDFVSPHPPPPITEGRWYVEDDGLTEIDIVDEKGRVLASIDLQARATTKGDPAFEADAQCIALVPELVRGIYVAMRALRGAIPDDETPETIAAELGELLMRCYASPKEGGTIKP